MIGLVGAGSSVGTQEEPSPLKRNVFFLLLLLLFCETPVSAFVAKVTELKSLANHVVVGSVSCEMLDLFCPLPQTLAVDINDLGTVKLNLEVTWRC